MNSSLWGQDSENVTGNCSIDGFKRSVYPATYLLTFTLGLMGGAVSLCSFVSLIRTKGRLTAVNLYMLNLLVSDLMLVCSLPFRAAYYLMGSNWIFGDVTCRVISFVFYINMYSSIYFLMVLSVMRYLAITHPYKYVQLQSSRSSWVVCLLVWVVVSLASTPLLGAGSVQDRGHTRCLDLAKKNVDTIVKMNYASVFLGFVLPFAVISFCYVFVVHSLLKPREVRGPKRPCYRKSCALVVIVLAIFFICFLPYHVVRILFLHAEWQLTRNVYASSCHYIEGLHKAAVVTLCLAVANSCLDPLLFFFAGENFWKFCNRKGKLVPKSRNVLRKMVNMPNTELQELKA
ncbi:cysteinyl leukotriene receptor 2 [Megalops cyprinoides]|uniref:cysteinyl leukotriene receptor 2 n=1 Tax=Megalops cyprinoides TaxID=118141 RepID=UPI0018656564|nr:cysteinyl leukotriene receptor 2 [Megalops cyprinoides]